MTATPGRCRRLPLVLVAAVAENGIIGRAGGLPWRTGLLLLLAYALGAAALSPFFMAAACRNAAS